MPHKKDPDRRKLTSRLNALKSGIYACDVTSAAAYFRAVNAALLKAEALWSRDADTNSVETLVPVPASDGIEPNSGGGPHGLDP